MIKPSSGRTQSDSTDSLADLDLKPTNSAIPEDGTVPSLKARVIGGSIWTFAGFGAGVMIRLASNLVLTRLLFPEAFGLMTYVYVVLTGVTMFSNIGIRASILQDNRGDDPIFLNTAWILQILRGILLFLIICALAWPASLLYDQPVLVWLLPVAALSALFEGFASTAKDTLARRVTPGREIALQVGTQIASSVLMIAVALVWQSVWVLVIGVVVGALLHALLTYRLIPGYSNQFVFDWDIARSIILFGRWVLLSSALTFLIWQGDRLVLGKLMSAEELGIYSIAFALADAIVSLIARLSHNVLHPVFSELARGRPQELREKTFKLRAVIMIAAMPAVWTLAVFGQQIVDFLYDPRYADAGWMLQILSVGAIGAVITVSTDRLILAVGDAFGYMCFSLSRFILLLLGITIGIILGDIRSVLFGIAGARLLEYVPLAVLLHRHDAWLPKLDGVVFISSALVVPLGIYLVGSP